MALTFGAGGETRTHGGYPTAYKAVAIAAMRLQLNLYSASVASTTVGAT